MADVCWDLGSSRRSDSPMYKLLNFCPQGRIRTNSIESGFLMSYIFVLQITFKASDVKVPDMEMLTTIPQELH